MQGEIRERVQILQKNQRRPRGETRWKDLLFFRSVRRISQKSEVLSLLHPVSPGL